MSPTIPLGRAHTSPPTADTPGTDLSATDPPATGPPVTDPRDPAASGTIHDAKVKLPKMHHTALFSGSRDLNPECSYCQQSHSPTSCSSVTDVASCK